MKKGTKLYEITVFPEEDKILKDLTTKYNWFFDNLADEDKKEWDIVVNAGNDYIIPDEPNAQNINTKYPGILIAPAFSRFKNDIPNGLLYLKGGEIKDELKKSGKHYINHT